jgi:hypothetical protein
MTQRVSPNSSTAFHNYIMALDRLVPVPERFAVYLPPNEQAWAADDKRMLLHLRFQTPRADPAYRLVWKPGDLSPEDLPWINPPRDLTEEEGAHLAHIIQHKSPQHPPTGGDRN